jgi:DNA-binding SARP family transcriptional activator
MLALRPGQVVPASQLIDGLWAEHAPSGAPNALQALVSRLRRALPEAVIEPRPAGYQLTLDPRDTDIVRFEELAAAGQAQLRADPAAAAATLREALNLWRGPALVDVAGTEFRAAIIARLDEQKLAATEHRIDADLLTGVTDPLVAELEELVVAHPPREPLTARLMRALHASGRRSAALEVYEQTRKRLADQLGADPSAELAALHLELLTEAPKPAPHTNLRAELTSFVGRDGELAEVAGLLGAHGRQVRGAGRPDGQGQRAGAGLELLRSPGRDDRAVVDDRDLAGQQVGFLQVLGGQQDGDPGRGQAAHHLPHLVAAAQVEPGRRLVQVEHSRSADQAGGQVQAPAHAAGVRLHRPVGRVLEPERGQQVPRPAPGRSRDWPVSRPMSTRFSSPVRVSSTDAYCPVSPVSCRTWCARRTTS